MESTETLKAEDILEFINLYLELYNNDRKVKDCPCSLKLLNAQLVRVVAVDCMGCLMCITEKGVAYMDKLLKVELPKQVWK